jgi:hypothetical protein
MGCLCITKERLVVGIQIINVAKWVIISIPLELDKYLRQRRIRLHVVASGSCVDRDIGFDLEWQT